MNKLTKPIEKSVAGVKRIFPRHNVVSQLKTLMADGTAISNVNKTKIDPRKGFNPVTNIWCAQTRKARIVMANNEPTIAIYPNMGFREFTASTSETIPMEGKMIIYTSG